VRCDDVAVDEIYVVAFTPLSQTPWRIYRHIAIMAVIKRKRLSLFGSGAGVVAG
jgi:hypothetical protein